MMLYKQKNPEGEMATPSVMLKLEFSWKPSGLDMNIWNAFVEYRYQVIEIELN